MKKQPDKRFLFVRSFCDAGDPEKCKEKHFVVFEYNGNESATFVFEPEEILLAVKDAIKRAGIHKVKRAKL